MTTPSAEKNKGFADTLLSFQIFLISRAKLSHFVYSFKETYGSRELLCLLQMLF